MAVHLGFCCLVFSLVAARGIVCVWLPCSRHVWSEGVSFLLQTAALHLGYAEYDDMSLLERMAILRGLCGLVLSSDAVRDVIGARMDAIAALQPKAKVKALFAMIRQLVRAGALSRCCARHHWGTHGSIRCPVAKAEDGICMCPLLCSRR